MPSRVQVTIDRAKINAWIQKMGRLQQTLREATLQEVKKSLPEKVKKLRTRLAWRIFEYMEQELPSGFHRHQNRWVWHWIGKVTSPENLEITPQVRGNQIHLMVTWKNSETLVFGNSRWRPHDFSVEMRSVEGLDLAAVKRILRAVRNA